MLTTAGPLGNHAEGPARRVRGTAALLRWLACALLLLAGPVGQAQSSPPTINPPVPATPYGQRVLLAPGDSAARQFGDIMLCYRLAPSGTAVQCTLYVATQLAGIRQLNATAPTFSFDVQVGYGKAHGTLALQLIAAPQPGQISTLSGKFTYSGNNQQFIFKGDLVGWYTLP